MQFLYTIGIRIYALLLHLATPFSPKAKLWVKGRENIFETLQKSLAGNTKKVVWMHVSSLGEFEQGRPLLEQLKEKHTDSKIVLSFFSPSGYEIRKNDPLADVTVYLPIDTPYNAKTFFDIVKPSKVFFVKYDFWYHYLHEAYKRKIPTFLISALFREEQLFFKPYGGFYRKILHFFTTIFTQDEKSAALLKSVNYESVVVCGDTRVDRVAALALQVQPISYITTFKAGQVLLVAGSTWQADEELWVKFLTQNKQLSLKVIFAPHEVHESHIAQLEERLKEAKISSIRYSDLSEALQLEDYSVLVVDTIGLLSALYSYGDIAYIGGGFGAGIHNTLEPATFGLPILFGEKYHKFNEAVSLLEQGGAFSVKKYEELEAIVKKLLQNSTFRMQAGACSKSFVDQQKGATQAIVSFCFSEKY